MNTKGTNKRKFFAAILILVLLGLFAKWDLRQRKTVSPTSSDVDTAATASNEGHSGVPSVQSPQQSELPASERSYPKTNGRSEQNIEEMFRGPIEFYGKVVDENRNPVAAADISFSWNELTVSNQIATDRAQAKSDDNGFFSLERRSGEGLDVRISKSGYYVAKSNAMSFQYSGLSGMPAHNADRNNPVIFVLVKKGTGASLITSKRGMGDDFGISPPRDGTPLKIDLLNFKTGEGPLEISQIKPDPKNWKQAQEWFFQMKIPDGGFVEYRHQDFPFDAPESGYDSTVRFDLKKGETNWDEAISRDFYIRFGSPPLYGRLHLETAIDGGVRLTYAINPDGTHNLEPQ